MAEHARRHHPRKDFRTLEEIVKEKERVRKLKQTISEQADYNIGVSDYDPLLEALIKAHPEKDPAKVK